jgi:hypothetical protein
LTEFILFRHFDPAGAELGISNFTHWTLNLNTDLRAAEGLHWVTDMRQSGAKEVNAQEQGGYAPWE